MFAPTKSYRKWTRKVSVNQRRYAVVSAIAATAIPALVMARGHKVDEVQELPLVVDDSAQKVQKTANAVKMLERLGAAAELQHVRDSKKIRSGKGKMRNRRYVMRKGPLVIYASNDGIEQGFRNFPGVELANVDRLNLLQLAPGGHMGRFVIYTQAAFEKLDTIYGAAGKAIPVAEMANADLARIINSDEIQAVVNPAKSAPKKYLRKKNAIKSIKALEKLSPYQVAARKSETKAQESRKGKKATKKAAKRGIGKDFFEKMKTQGDVCEDGF